ncbi:MAG: NAD(P)/FAD-dependent oxidoreductase [Bradymonadia bacterium]
MARRPAVDLAILGSNLVACAIAREAARAGAKVRLVDPGVLTPSGPVPGAVLGWTRAEPTSPLNGLRGLGLERLAAWVKGIEADAGQHVALGEGALIPAFEMQGLQQIHQKAAWLKEGGRPFKAMTAGDARALEPGLPEDVVAALSVPEDVVTDRQALRRALAAGAAEAGAQLYLGTPILGLIEGPRGAVAGVRVPEGPLEAAVTIVCTDIGPGPSALPVSVQRQPVLTLQEGRWPRRTIWSPEGYITPDLHGNVHVVGPIKGASLDPRLTTEEMMHLLNLATTLTPALSELPVGPSGVINHEISADGLPIVGPDEAVSLLQVRALGDDELVLAPIIAPLVVEYLQTGRTESADWSALSPLRLRS